MNSADAPFTGTYPRQVYSRAPILEAVIDIGVRLPSSSRVEILKDIAWPDIGRFGPPQPRVRAAIQLDGASRTITAQQEPDGWIFTDETQHVVLQARLDGFALSRLAPYDRWETFQESAKACWKAYCDTAKPLDIVRVALRYVNRLDLPLPFDDFREYLQTYPEVAPALPQALSSFVFQLQAPLTDIESGMLVLHEGIVESPRPDTASILLDIDVFQTVTLPADANELWHAIEALHLKKNEVFEACITDKARALIR